VQSTFCREMTCCVSDREVTLNSIYWTHCCVITLIWCSWWCYTSCCWQLAPQWMSNVERLQCWWSKSDMWFV